MTAKEWNYKSIEWKSNARWRTISN